MAEVLVLAEHAGGEVKKVTLELLTAAARLGEPAVVWTGPGAEAAQSRLAEYGAARVYVAEGGEFDEYVVAPKAELLARLVADKAALGGANRPAPPRARRSRAGWRSRRTPGCSPMRST